VRKILPLLLVLLCATAAFAQTNKGRIVGTVTTADGLAIADVTVTISSPALIGTTMTTTTNERGMYRFVLLPLGTYSIKFEKEGYSTIEQGGIVLPFDSTITLDKVMEAAEFEQVITITGESPVVDKTSSAVGDKLDTDFLQNMPNTRSIWSMPNLTAGFTNNSALGAPERGGNALTQDGAIIHDPATKTVFARINYEAVEQVDVAMFGSPAEYSSFTGASLNFVTKSGGNEFHGEVNYFHQDLDWISDNTQNYRQYGFTAPSGNDIMDPNLAIGGPVLHDKVWFYGTYNYSKEKHQHEIIDGVINADYIPTIWSIKFSSRWDNRNLTSFSYTDYYRDRPYRVAYGSWRTNYDGSLYKQVSEGRTWLLLHSYVLSNDVIVEGRWSKFKGGFSLQGRDPSGHIYRDYNTGYMLQGTNDKHDIYDRPRDTILGTLNYFNDDMQGSHSMKFGVEYERGVSGRDYYNRFYYRPKGDTPYRWYDYGEYDSRSVLQRIAGFAQDSWSLTEKLTVNIGVRIDKWWTKTGTPDAPGLMGNKSFRKMTDVAPRLGFAYDLFGDGSTVLRGFYGRYFEGVTAGVDRALITNTPPSRYYKWTSSGWYNYSTVGGTIPGAVEMDDNIKNNYTEGVMFAVERELRENIAGSITFIYKRDNDLRGAVYPNATWTQGTASYSNENGSYNGVYYYDFIEHNPTYYTNPKKGDYGVLGDVVRSYYGLIFEVNKRMSDNWSLKANYTWSKSKSPTSMTYGVVQGGSVYNNPNDWVNMDGALSSLDRTHVLKVSGTYIAPFDIYISPVFTWMTGTPYGIYYRPSGQDYSVLIKKIDGKERYDNRLNIDLRLEKSFVFLNRFRAGVILDVFNLTNSDYLTGYVSTRINSSSFKIPTSIADARIYQLGFRLMF